MKPVLTKKDFQRRFLANEFGNRGPVWDTLEEFLAAGYRGLIHLRNRVAGGTTYYDVPSAEVPRKHREATANGDRFYIAAMAPTEKTLFQGEVALLPSGLYLLYSTIAKPMRVALAERKQEAHGIIGLGLLRSYLDPSSYDWLRDLLEEYPNHIVEFSTYSANWGTIPHRNTVIWEVRKY